MGVLLVQGFLHDCCNLLLSTLLIHMIPEQPWYIMTYMLSWPGTRQAAWLPGMWLHNNASILLI